MSINWSRSFPFLVRSWFVISSWWRIASRQCTWKPSNVNLLVALWGAISAFFHLPCHHLRLKHINWCVPPFSVLFFLMDISTLGFHFDSLDRSERLCTWFCFGPSFFILMCSDFLHLSFVLIIRYTDQVFHSLTLYPLSSGLFAIIVFFYNLFHIYLPFLSVLHTCLCLLVPFARFACHVLFLMDMMRRGDA